MVTQKLCIFKTVFLKFCSHPFRRFQQLRLATSRIMLFYTQHRYCKRRTRVEGVWNNGASLSKGALEDRERFCICNMQRFSSQIQIEPLSGRTRLWKIDEAHTGWVGRGLLSSALDIAGVVRKLSQQAGTELWPSFPPVHQVFIVWFILEAGGSCIQSESISYTPGRGKKFVKLRMHTIWTVRNASRMK